MKYLPSFVEFRAFLCGTLFAAIVFDLVVLSVPFNLSSWACVVALATNLTTYLIDRSRA